MMRRVNPNGIQPDIIMENIIYGGIASLLFIYLLVAMIRPEKF